MKTKRWAFLIVAVASQGLAWIGLLLGLSEAFQWASASVCLGCLVAAALCHLYDKRMPITYPDGKNIPDLERIHQLEERVSELEGQLQDARKLFHEALVWRIHNLYVNFVTDIPMEDRSDLVDLVVALQTAKTKEEWMAAEDSIWEIFTVKSYPAHELWLDQHPEAKASVMRGIEQARRGELVDVNVEDLMTRSGAISRPEICTAEEFEKQRGDASKRFYIDHLGDGAVQYQLIDRIDGRVLGYDGGEPEDQLLVRDWNWVAVELNALDKTIKSMAAVVEAARKVATWANTKQDDGFHPDLLYMRVGGDLIRAIDALDASKGKVKP